MLRINTVSFINYSGSIGLMITYYWKSLENLDLEIMSNGRYAIAELYLIVRPPAREEFITVGIVVSHRPENLVKSEIYLMESRMFICQHYALTT
jgi:hypothetical protein